MLDKRFVGLAMTGLRSNFGRLDLPYKLTFAITYRCQSRCLTCNIWQMRPNNELTLDEIRSFVQKNPHFKWISITGGEPFLRSDIVDIVKAFYENSKGLYIITMPTNSLCDTKTEAERIERILQTGIPKLSITLSLDGYREMHDKIRGIPGNYDKVIRLCKELSELKKRYKNLFFEFGYTMSRYNQGGLEKTYEEVKKELPGITRNDFHLNLGQISDMYYKNSAEDIKANNEAVAQEIAEFISKRRFKIDAISLLESAFLKRLVQFAKTGKNPMKSRSLDASLFMDSFGDVYPSIMWNRKIGNIREHDYDLKGLWKGSAAEEVREIIKKGEEPPSWTACEAYQCLTGRMPSLI